MMTHTLHSGVERTVERLLNGPAFPDRPFTEERTHGDLFAMARAILHSCPPDRDQGEFLGIFTEDRAAIAAAVLAALAGGPVLVFPHDISDTALAELKNNTGITRVVADPDRRLPEAVARVSIDPVPGSSSKMPLKPFNKNNAPLLKLHTGGSTGKPTIWTKTVENIIAEARFHVGVHRVTPDDVILATVPPYHIYGLLFSVVVPLMAGGSVVGRTCGFPREIINAVHHGGATLLVSVPVHYRALKGHDFGNHGLRLALSSAGTLESGVESAFRSQTGVPVMEIYGSTETGGIAFRCRARNESFFTPFDSIKIRIEGSELRIRSSFVSQEITMDDHGFYPAPDRVEPCPGNSFAILGRSDTIVKIAGKRVDLDHVKVVLSRMPGVRDAVVYARSAPTGRQFDIYALIEGDCDSSGIREYLAVNLEAAAHLRRFRIVERMPMTRAGKYDRSAIEALFAEDNGRKA